MESPPTKMNEVLYKMDNLRPQSEYMVQKGDGRLKFKLTPWPQDPNPETAEQQWEVNYHRNRSCQACIYGDDSSIPIMDFTQWDNPNFYPDQGPPFLQGDIDQLICFVLAEPGDRMDSEILDDILHVPLLLEDWEFAKLKFRDDSNVMFCKSWFGDTYIGASSSSTSDEWMETGISVPEILNPPTTIIEKDGSPHYVFYYDGRVHQPAAHDEEQNVEVLIFSDEEQSEETRSFFSCEDFSDEGHTPSSSASQEEIPEETYSMPVTLSAIQKQPDMVQQKIVKRMPRSLRRTVENNAKKKAGYACIKEVLIDDNYDYMLPPLPAGYKKKNQGCGWSRELRPNDKYEYGPKYGVKLLKSINLSEEATEKAKRIWLSVGTGTFDPAIMAQGFKLVGKLLYDQNYYNIKNKDCETLKCARQKLALVLSGHRLQRCDFVMRRPVPCKNKALRIWLRNYKFCLKNFCGLKSDRVAQYLDDLKTKNQAFMQGDFDEPSTATSFFETMKSGISGTIKRINTYGASAATSVGSKIKKMQSDTVSSLLNSGTKMLLDGLMTSMYKKTKECLKSGLANIKGWITSIREMITSFMSSFSDAVIATVPIDKKMESVNKSMWACLAIALFVLVTLSWWTSSLASSVFMSIIAFSLDKIGVSIDRKSSKDFVEAIYSDDAVMQGCSSTFEKFGKAFIGLFSLGTIGSVTNIIARMPQVKNNIKDFFMWLIDSIYSLFSKGKHFFPDYQEIDDLGKFISTTVDFFNANTRAKIFTNDVASREILRLGAEVPKFKRTLALTSGLSGLTSSYYNNVLINLEKIAEEVRTRAWVTQARIEPTWFSMYGKPGQGKSDTYQIMPKHVYDRVSAALPDLFPQAYHPGMVYEKASGQEFCDGYNPETHVVFAIEELAAMADPKTRGLELGLMQKMISRAPLPLTCAELSMKNNTFFASPFVCTTSNITDDELAASSGLTRATTIFRRRHFHVEVMIKPGHTVPQDQLLSRPDECWIYRMHYKPSQGQWIKLALRNTGIDFPTLVKNGYIDFKFSELADLMAKKIIFDYNKSKTDRSFYLQNFGAHFKPGVSPPPPPPTSSSSSSSSSSEFFSDDSSSDSDSDGPNIPPDFAEKVLESVKLEIRESYSDSLEEESSVEIRPSTVPTATNVDQKLPSTSDVPEIHKTVQDYLKNCEDKKKEEELPSLNSEHFDTEEGNAFALKTKILLNAWNSTDLSSYLGGHVKGKKWWAKLDPWVQLMIRPHLAKNKRDNDGFMMKIVDRLYLDEQFRLFMDYYKRNQNKPIMEQTPIEVPPRLLTFYGEKIVYKALHELVFQSDADMQGLGDYDSAQSDEELIEWQDLTTTTTITKEEEKPTFDDGNYINHKIEADKRFIKWDTRRILAEKWLEIKESKDSWWSSVQQSRLYRTFFSAPDRSLFVAHQVKGPNEQIPYPLWHDGDSIQIDRYMQLQKDSNVNFNLILPTASWVTDEMRQFWGRIFGTRQDRKNLYGDLIKLSIWVKIGATIEDASTTDPKIPMVERYLGHTVCALKRLDAHLNYVCPAFYAFFALVRDKFTGMYPPEGAEQCAVVARIKYISIESEEEAYSKKAKRAREGRIHAHASKASEKEFKAYIKEEVAFVKQHVPNDTLILITYQAYRALQTFWKGTKEWGTGMFHTVGGFFYQYGYIIAAILAGVCCYVLLLCGITALVGHCLKASASKGLAKSTIKRVDMQTSQLQDADIKCLLNKQNGDEFVTFQSFSRGHYASMSKKDKVRMQSKLEDSIDIQINNISNNMRSFVFYYDDKGREAHGVISGRRCFINKHFFSTWGQNWSHMEIRNGDEVLHTLQRSELSVQLDPTPRDLAWFDLGKGFNSMPSLKRHLISQENFDTILGTHEIARIHRIKSGGKVTHRYALGKGAARGEHKTLKAKLPNDKPFNLHLGEHFVTTGMESKNGDCGLPYVTTTESGVVKILGLHCALANSQSVFLPLYLDDEAQKTAYMQGDGKVIVNQGTYIPTCVRNPTPERKQAFDGRLVSLGSLPRGDFMPTETKIEASVFQGDLTTPPIYPITVAPAMLKPMTVDVEDEITGEVTPILRQPLKQGIIKMVSAPRRIFPRWMQELFEQEPEIAFAGFFPSTKRKFRMYTIEEAIQQLDMQASIGFDFKVEGFKSRDELWRKATETQPAWINPVLRNKVMELFIAMKAGYELKNVVSACLKDETRDLERVYEGKTRIFCVGSLAHLIMTIMVVGDVVFYMKENHLDTDVCIGINPHGPEWWILAEKLKRHKNFGGGDYSGFDSGIIAKFGYALYLAMKWYINSGDPLYDWYLYNVCMSSIAPIFVINGECYWSDWMNSSGGWLTGFLNSFVNSCIFNAFHWWVCQENNLGERSRLVDLVCAFYGDDNLWSVCDDLKEFITMKTLGDFIWACFGMKYTTAQKTEIDVDFLEFDDLEFLCRRFRPRGNLYTAPLDKESIFGMLLWIKKSNIRTPADQLAINVEQAMMEFFHYGPETFRREEKRIRTYCDIYNIAYTAGSYEYYEDRWGTGMMHNRA